MLPPRYPAPPPHCARHRTHPRGRPRRHTSSLIAHIGPQALDIMRGTVDLPRAVHVTVVYSPVHILLVPHVAAHLLHNVYGAAHVLSAFHVAVHAPLSRTSLWAPSTLCAVRHMPSAPSASPRMSLYCTLLCTSPASSCTAPAASSSLPMSLASAALLRMSHIAHVAVYTLDLAMHPVLYEHQQRVQQQHIVLYTYHRAVVRKLLYAPSYASFGYTDFPEVPQVSNQPRIKYLYKSKKHRFMIYKDNEDERIEAEDVLLSPVTDDLSFIKRFDVLTKIIVSSAEEIFGRMSRYKKCHSVTSSKIQAIVTSIRSLGSAIRHLKSDYQVSVAFKSSTALTITLKKG
ncbi:hypothetical protein B0H14DRAFT_3744253 [Mycena olivaceomarginata]|nr:hypothetical protein B0H14DRAFT_3744253 [Mycena olivaceomarginata]